MVECFYDLAVMSGMFVCVFVMAGMYLFIRSIDQIKLKAFFWRLNDADKLEVLKSLEDIQNKYEGLAVKTNTLFCRRQKNKVSDMINFLKKHRLN